MMHGCCIGLIQRQTCTFKTMWLCCKLLNICEHVHGFSCFLRSRAAGIGDPKADMYLQNDVALQTSGLNWLQRSHVADNPLVLKGVVLEVRTYIYIYTIYVYIHIYIYTYIYAHAVMNSASCKRCTCITTDNRQILSPLNKLPSHVLHLLPSGGLLLQSSISERAAQGTALLIALHMHSTLANFICPLLFLFFQVGCSSKAALVSVLRKELLLQQLYKAEVQCLVYTCQSRALGKKLVCNELQVGLVCVIICPCPITRSSLRPPSKRSHAHSPFHLL